MGLFAIAQPIKAAAGLQTLADGATEVQLAATAACAALGGQFTVELTCDGVVNADLLLGDSCGDEHLCSNQFQQVF